MRIAVDAMGGDHAPAEIVRGAVEAVSAFEVEVLLVGESQAVSAVLQKTGYRGERIILVEAPEVIGMDEHPVEALRKKKRSSLVVANELVRDGQADAVVSAGSTGAAMACSLLRLGKLPGIERPAIATTFPTLRGFSVLIDAGANADCRPVHLVKFAQMGALYAEKVLGVDNPRVGLLNIGEEETKGNELALAVYAELKKSSLNFIGNVEGRDVPAGKADVVVCDGFVGNVVLKFMEGMAGAIFHLLKEELSRDWRGMAGGLLLKPAFKRILRRTDYAEYGGAPLLGLKGVSIIAHGSSNARAIRNAIRVAKESVEKGVVEAIATGTKETEMARRETNNA
ncbi:MAG: phosphate acyltransferase PlsX [Bacillota bacterium]|nr:phosphate acyltransferase PlsX [Bacillota bacterium]